MEGTIGEIRLFAASFNPRSWAYCQGQIMAITQNTALFSILGNTYGGDGKVTFGLPDLSARVAIGAGNGPGLTPRVLGETGGAPGVTVGINQMPAHTHAVIGTPALMISNADADSVTPATTSALAATKLSNGTPLNGYVASSPNIALNSASAQVTAVTTNGSIVGGNQPHSNMQPSLGLAYIICLTGIFPQRP